MAFVPADIEGDQTGPFEPQTISCCVDAAARLAGERTAMKQYGSTGEALGALAFAELRDASTRLAGYLAARFGKGDCIGLWGNSGIGWVVCELAILRIGATVVTLDPGLRGDDLEHLLRIGDVCGVLMDRRYRGNDMAATLAAVQPRVPGLRHRLWIDEWREMAAEAVPFIEDPSTPDDPALIVFTSGTTGKPKGVVLHHGGVVGNAYEAMRRTGLRNGGALLNPLPAYSIGGAVSVTIGALAHRMEQIMVQHFDAGVVIDLSRRERLGWMPLVPAMLLPLTQHARFGEADFSALEAVWMGGTVISPEHVELARRMLGVNVVTMYGQTESGGVQCMNVPGASAEVISTTVGIPLAHGRLRIADLATGETVARGVIGEIRAQSPYMTRAYFRNPEATAGLLDRFGYLQTGDLGMIGADGNLRITGRLKEMIIRGGRNVYPREIEDVLSGFPGVAEVAVMGVPHPRWGEEVAAAIRPLPGASVDVDAAQAFVADRLAGYKIPKLWRLVDDFPRGSQGKIRKIDLVGLFLEPAS